MAPIRVDVEPAVLEWAIERSGREAYLYDQHPRLPMWLDRTASPTLKQLQEFARHAYVPEGYMFLSEPPVETIPIPDFRTPSSTGTDGISPNLRAVIYVCQRRQSWYRRYAAANGYARREFVGSARASDDPEAVADAIRQAIGWDSELRKKATDVSAYRRAVVDRAERAGILVMISGIVGDNAHRPLAPQEFRGFALHDDYAPLVFVNGADAPTAQIFTLAHEFAHLWRGESGLSDSDARPFSVNESERWCNAVAAEVVVPRREFAQSIDGSPSPLDHVDELRDRFKVSGHVIVRRLLTLGRIDESEYRSAYRKLQGGFSPRSAGRGNYRYTKPVRVSRRFASAVFSETLSLRTTNAEAFDLLEVKKGDTFESLAETLGFQT